MKNASSLLLFSLLIMCAACTACQSKGSGGGGGGDSGSNPGGPTLEDQSQLCNPHCKMVAYDKKMSPTGSVPVQLSPAEEGSLKAAMASTPVKEGSTTAHLHEDVVNGKLAFTPDATGNPESETHLGDEIVLQNPEAASSGKVTVVATPAALQMMKERTAGKQ